MSDQEVIEQTNLDAIIGDEDIAEPEPQEIAAEEAEVTEQSDEDPEEGQVTEEEPAEEPESDEGQKMVPMSVVHGLRDELKALKEQQTKPAETQREPAKESLPDPIEDPEGYEAALTARIEQNFTARRLQDSEARAKQAHEDFDEKFALFNRAAALEPAMVDDVLAHPDPAERAYQLALEVEKTLRPADSAEIRSEIEKEMAAQFEAKHQKEIADLKKEIADLKLKNQLPDDLSGVSTDGSMRSSKNAPPELTPLDDVLKS